MNDEVTLELDDIQSGVLRPRPTPYAASYLLFRVDDARGGRAFLRHARGLIASAAHSESPAADAWISLALTFRGLEAISTPRASLDSFPQEFREGMAARAASLGDIGASSPAHWESPLGSGDVHIIVTAIAPDRERLDGLLDRQRRALADVKGVARIWKQDCYILPDEHEAFGYLDGVSHPAIEGSGSPGSNPLERPYKAGEFVLGYIDEMGMVQDAPEPAILGRNGTYVAFRKLHQRVAAFRRFLREQSTSPEAEELLAAKMMGRWRSGAPLALCPVHDDAELGADPARRNAFLYLADDEVGWKTPPGCHIRRTNPRDGLERSGTSVRIRRMIRRGTSYGPVLPDGMLDDDGADRGLMFAFVGAHLRRQFEFVQSVWINGGEFIASTGRRDPITGAQDAEGDFTIPRRPVRRRIAGLPQFVVTRGGEYGFMPGLRALDWLAGQGQR